MGNNRLRWDVKDLTNKQQELLHMAEENEQKVSKYYVGPAEKRRYNGILFDSIKEMEYYKQLLLLCQAGEIVFFLRQVPFDLPGGIKYFVDFLVFYPDRHYQFVDVKGYATPTFQIKKKQVEALYPVRIEVL